jgi:hypothetical protein
MTASRVATWKVFHRLTGCLVLEFTGFSVAGYWNNSWLFAPSFSSAKPPVSLQNTGLAKNAGVPLMASSSRHRIRLFFRAAAQFWADWKEMEGCSPDLGETGSIEGRIAEAAGTH